MEYEIEVYETADGKLPFNDWLLALKDLKARQAIRTRLARMRLGNFGNSKPLSVGLSELKIDFGPGYRLYFSRIGRKIILLLCAGDKGTQTRDIEKAKKYLKDFKMHQQEGSFKNGKK